MSGLRRKLFSLLAASCLAGCSSVQWELPKVCFTTQHGVEVCGTLVDGGVVGTASYTLPDGQKVSVTGGWKMSQARSLTPTDVTLPLPTKEEGFAK